MKHPMQKVYRDEQRVIRFQPNRIVQALLDNGPFDMNKLAMLDFPRADREQFAQLIGYSVSGFSSLDYVSDKAITKADAKVKKLLEDE